MTYFINSHQYNINRYKYQFKGKIFTANYSQTEAVQYYFLYAILISNQPIYRPIFCIFVVTPLVEIVMCEDFYFDSVESAWVHECLYIIINY